MLKINLVEFSRHPLPPPAASEALVGVIECGAEARVYDYEIENGGEIWRLAKHNVRQRIWGLVYGDIHRAILPLHHHAVAAAKSATEADLIDAEFKALLTLLEYPKITAETADAPVKKPAR